MIIIVMGVAGFGESSVGRKLADADRLLWLRALRWAVTDRLHEHRNAVLACSALKSAYREILMVDRKDVRLVSLKGTDKTLERRLAHRRHHFMAKTLLQSQYDVVEEATETVTMDAGRSPEQIMRQVRAACKRNFIAILAAATHLDSLVYASARYSPQEHMCRMLTRRASRRGMKDRRVETREA